MRYETEEAYPVNVSRPPKGIDDEHRQRLEAAAERRRESDEEMKAAVLAASDAGGSVRVIAAIGMLSKTTVQNWINARD